MSIKAIIVILSTAVALSIFVHTLYVLYSLLRKAKPSTHYPPIWQSIKDFFVMVLGQKKVLRWHYSGVLHAMIFWGFLVLFTTIVEMYGEAFDPEFVFPIIGGTAAMAFSQNLFTLLVLLGVLMAFVLRVFVKPKRYEGSDHTDAIVILGCISLIGVTLLFMHAQRVQHGMTYAIDGFFVSRHIAAYISPGILNPIADVSYWIHLGIILFFINWVPRGKHLHLLAIVPNIMLRKSTPRGKLRTLDLDDEDAEVFGANNWSEFTWKDMLDTYACMECGRCVAVCPANITGKELNPKKLHTGIRYAVQNNAKELLSEKAEFPNLLENIFSEDFFWQCTTCGACVEECPATNDHIDKIMDVRRYMVLTEGKMKPETAQAMKSLENQYNPFTMSHESRFEWTEGKSIPTMKENPDAEYLYWVGCFGCFDDRNKKVTEDLCKVMDSANVSYAVLQGEEKCTGDPARRAGNEYLFQMLAEENVETLNKYKNKKIITQCPHCFNTIKNEYPDFGGNFEIIHHSELIDNLISDGKIQLKNEVNQRMVYHDSCYLGRHNNQYKAPRNALKKVKGAKLLEMERSHSKSFCCGAGGSGMFMEETVGKRINVERVEEAARTNPDVMVSNCPFCLSMFEDGIKSASLQDQFKPVDLVEIIAKAIEDTEEQEITIKNKK